MLNGNIISSQSFHPDQEDKQLKYHNINKLDYIVLEEMTMVKIYQTKKISLLTSLTAATNKVV